MSPGAARTKLEHSWTLDLLGLLQLARKGRAPKGLESLVARIRRFRMHPAVRLYAAHLDHEGDPSGLLSAFLTPRLAWRVDPATLSDSFFDDAGGRRAFEGFLSALKALSAQLGAPKPAEAAALRKARAELAAAVKAVSPDPLAAAERWLREKQDASCRILVSPLYAPRLVRAYIAPYPYGGPGVEVEGPFDVVMLAGRGMQPPFTVADFPEPLYLVFERAFMRHEAAVRGLVRLRERLGPGRWPHSVVDGLVRTAVRRMAGRPCGWPRELDDAPDPRLSAAFDAYERSKAPLAEFFPRLLEALK